MKLRGDKVSWSVMQENRNSFQVSGIKVFNSATNAAKNKTSVKMSRGAFAHIVANSQ